MLVPNLLPKMLVPNHLKPLYSNAASIFFHDSTRSSFSFPNFPLQNITS